MRRWRLLVRSLIAAIGLAAALGDRAAAAPVSVSDLIQVVDLADAAVSPNGQMVAIRAIRPNIKRNQTSVDWIVINLQTGAVISQVPGGEWIDYFMHKPQWSPDSQLIYYLSLTKGEVQIWSSSIATGTVSQVTHELGDVEEFILTSGGLDYSVSVPRSAIVAEEEREYRRGIVVDSSRALLGSLFRGHKYRGRWSTLFMSSLPLLSDVPRQYFRMSLPDRKKEQLSTRPRNLGGPEISLIDRAIASSKQSGIDVAVFAGRAGTPETIEISVVADGVRTKCPLPACGVHKSQFVSALWTSDEKNVVVTTRFRDGSTDHRIDLWQPGQDTGRLLYTGGYPTSGTVVERDPCPTSAVGIICIISSAASPPRLVAIDVRGNIRTLYDPNGQLRRNLMSRRADQIAWRYDGTRRETGWLLYPSNYRPGVRYPLVITSYRCTGFLRGGNGIAVPAPEHSLTQHGFVVLCADLDTADDPTDSIGYGAPYIRLTRSWEAAINKLVSMGIVDPDRVGVAGTSFSAVAAAYAVTHSTRYLAAVSTPTGNLDPTLDDYFGAPGGLTYLSDQHITPKPGTPESEWLSTSPALNAQNAAAAYLIQASDVEFRGSIEFYAAYVRAKLPMEMAVYPGEDHNILEPVHRANSYQRSEDWFRFWLNNDERVDPVPWGDESSLDLERQYARWRSMRVQRSETLKSRPSRAN